VRAAPDNATVLHLSSVDEARRLLARTPDIGRGTGTLELIIREWCLELHLVARQVVSHDVRAELRGLEFWLLWELMDHAGKDISSAHLLAHVWGTPSRVDSTVVRQGIRTLRRTLRGIGAGVVVRTGSTGYRMELAADATCCEADA